MNPFHNHDDPGFYSEKSKGNWEGYPRETFKLILVGFIAVAYPLLFWLIFN